MTEAPRADRAYSFRSIPPAIYVALGINLAGALVVAIATMLAPADGMEYFQALERWWILDAGCDAAGTILLGVGVLELARRQVGPERGMTQAGAWLGFASVGGLVIQPLITIFEPGGDTVKLAYEWMGRGLGVCTLVGAVLLTIGADAWRRVPIAAAGLLAIMLTSYWVPGIGQQISELVGKNPTVRQLYGLGRFGVQVVALLFVIAALAANGREQAPDPRAAASGFRLARGMLVFRIAAALALAALFSVGRSPQAAKLALFAGPAIGVVTMGVFAIGIQRVASARIDGLPRLLCSLGAVLTLWWAAIQLQQLSSLIDLVKDGGERAMEAAQRYSIAGPIVATLGLALVGSAIGSLAWRRGDTELRGVATSQTMIFLATTLGGIGIQSQLAGSGSIGAALAMVVFSALAVIVGLVALARLLARAADAIDAAPGIPPARIV